MSDATWLPFPQNPDYLVSSDGQVLGLRRSILKARRNKYGYLQLFIKVATTFKTFEVHRVVCETFHGAPAPGHQVRHLNGDQLDNRADNLAWGTCRENAQDRVLHGTAFRVGDLSRKLKTHCVQGHPFDGQNTVMSAHAATGHLRRRCGKCQAQWKKESRARRRAQRLA